MSTARAGKYISRTSHMLEYLTRVGEQVFLRELSQLGMVLGPVWVAGEILIPEDAVAYAGTLHGLGMADLASEVLEALLLTAQGGMRVGEG